MAYTTSPQYVVSDPELRNIQIKIASSESRISSLERQLSDILNKLQQEYQNLELLEQELAQYLYKKMRSIQVKQVSASVTQERVSALNLEYTRYFRMVETPFFRGVEGFENIRISGLDVNRIHMEVNLLQAKIRELKSRILNLVSILGSLRF